MPSNPTSRVANCSNRPMDMSRDRIEQPGQVSATCAMTVLPPPKYCQLVVQLGEIMKKMVGVVTYNGRIERTG
jgi:hypothetical protein